MPENQDVRERLARVELGLDFTTRDLSRLSDHHRTISNSHSRRLYAAEQAINQVTRDQSQDRMEIDRLKRRDQQAAKLRARTTALLEAGKWIAGGLIALAILFDALPIDASKPLRLWLGLP